MFGMVFQLSPCETIENAELKIENGFTYKNYPLQLPLTQGERQDARITEDGE